MNRHNLLALALLPVLVYFRNPAIALFAGCLLTLLARGPALPNPMHYGKMTLQTAIILLGLTLNMQQMLELSADYSTLVTTYVLVTLCAGLLMGKVLQAEASSSKLVSSGTAICGGTAVASLSPVLRAEPQQTGSVLAIIFILNAVALFSFPMIGQWLDLSQTEFGIWCALAIHDTASVVATAALYGEEAMQVATTLKLGRTLWLIPLLLLFSVLERQRSTRLRIPAFIFLFILTSIIGSTLNIPDQVVNLAAWLSKALLVVALFLVGCEIDRETLARVRGRLLVHAIGLWLLVAPLTLFMILHLD